METGVEISVLCVFLWRFFVVLVVVVSCYDRSCGCNVWWVSVVLGNGLAGVEIGVVGFGWG